MAGVSVVCIVLAFSLSPLDGSIAQVEKNITSDYRMTEAEERPYNINIDYNTKNFS